MSQDEFFAFMPLLIYGIAVTELVRHWRDYLNKGRRYWPHLVTGLILLELAFVNFYYLYDTLEDLFKTYPHFLLRLTSPILLLLTVSVYTPENDRDVKEYFNDKAPLIFTLLGLFIMINVVTDLELNFINLIRSTAAIICFLLALTKKYWLIWLWVIIRLSMFAIQDFAPQLLSQ